MKRRSQLVYLGAALLLASCSGVRTANSPSQARSQPSPVVAANPQAANANPQAFPQPIVSPTAVVTVPAVPGLLRPTNIPGRLQTISPGRSDPFAAVPARSISFSATSRPAASPASSGKPSAISLAPLPVAPVTGLPSVAPLPLPAPNSALPSLPVPTAPAPSPTALADAVEVSGAIRVKGRWQVIVKESSVETSRYVGVGDYLEGGQVLVKKIIADGGADPTVVLQQNGREVTKSIGSTSIARRQ
ncbi:hypothetical protein H6F43_00385 [Leptolyngbya sp. FACHB-36]|uniref:hypothetical protein n=1 Tax=Leptolyngbya sp. FACHB-36 TaxID=2692808 RepID=UPI0016810B73|nr:hypothetical protein [Leptolyngbya sp. FACHB-36]MBD2018641.1 hypothetical protein [Leptolyngbya sp. FACHB-36]